MEAALLAYLAGLFDGEGSIMLVSARHKSFMEQRAKAGCFHPAFYPQVRIGMIEPEPIKLFEETFGFGVFVKEKSYHRKRPMYRWRVTRKQDAYHFCKKMKDFLRIKKPQAELLIDYVDNTRTFNGRKVPEEEHERRNNIWLMMRKLNGVCAPATTESRSQRGRDKSVRLEATV